MYSVLGGCILTPWAAPQSFFNPFFRHFYCFVACYFFNYSKMFRSTFYYYLAIGIGAAGVCMSVGVGVGVCTSDDRALLVSELLGVCIIFQHFPQFLSLLFLVGFFSFFILLFAVLVRFVFLPFYWCEVWACGRECVATVATMAAATWAAKHESLSIV